MKTITLHNTNLSVPEIGMGCMRINSLETADAVKEWIDTALAHDINFFDHADIYAKGQCEELFGKALILPCVTRSFCSPNVRSAPVLLLIFPKNISCSP